MSEGKLPLGWRDGLLSDIAQINPFVSYTGLNDDDEVTFLSMADVGENGRIIGKQDRSLQSIRFGFTRFQEGDVLFAKITPCMENGKGAFATPLRNRYGAGSTEFHVLRAKESGDPEFIYHVSLSPSLRNRAVAFFTGSAGQQRVSADFFSRYRLLLPPISEQRKIARILTTVDNLIEKTEALIAKYQAIKQGMMHDLFTRGVDENGHLRPTYEEAPHLYKPSELGWIPKEWWVASIGELFHKRTEHGKPGLPVMSIVMEDGLVERSSVDRRVESNLPPEGHALVCNGDIAYNMMRMWQGVLGRASFDCLVSPAYVVLKPRDAIDTQFAAYLFSDRSSILKFRRFSQGVVDDRLRLYFHDLVHIKFALPVSLSEQQGIADAIEGCDRIIAKETAALEQHKCLRAGLMQDLLTGKFRVKVDDSEENTTHA